MFLERDVIFLIAMSTANTNSIHLDCFGEGAEISETEMPKPGHIKPKPARLEPEEVSEKISFFL